MAYDMAEHEGRRGDLFMEQVWQLVWWLVNYWQVEPVASMVPYMTCPGNHEWHYNFTNYRWPGGPGGTCLGAQGKVWREHAWTPGGYVL